MILFLLSAFFISNIFLYFHCPSVDFIYGLFLAAVVCLLLLFAMLVPGSFSCIKWLITALFAAVAVVMAVRLLVFGGVMIEYAFFAVQYTLLGICTATYQKSEFYEKPEPETT